MDQFEKYCQRILEEESVLEKRRKFYPRKVKNAGGFTIVFQECLADEIRRLKEADPTITDQHILKSLEFEMKKAQG